jgi:7SK snRNA methylphosphate capping enzyme
MANSNPHNFRYRYGNFNHYKLSKEFCNPSHIFDQFIQSDPRVDLFCPDWFVNKSILDIGCNSGRFTISLARRFHPKRVIGFDMDRHLIGAARKNIRHFTDKDTKV